MWNLRRILVTAYDRRDRKSFLIFGEVGRSVAEASPLPVSPNLNPKPVHVGLLVKNDTEHVILK
jgi:hypothetical protein